jgi:dTDP-4-amino-4,6-dideoxygalactose transaminase
MRLIPHSRSTIGEDDIRSVSSVLKSGLLSQGIAVSRFEEKFSRYHAAKGGVAVSSGTAALHLALLALGIGRDDRVIVPTYACIAPYNAVRYTGAVPVLADTVKNGWAMDAEWVEAYLKKVTKKKRVKAIVLVHLFGRPVEMDAFLDISKRYSIPIIEDCAMSVGAEYNGKKVGTFGQVSVFSFYATKVIATGEGGMLIANSKKLLNSIRDLREYDEKKGAGLRFNYKMTDIQAALGTSQLMKLPGFIKRRRRIAKDYLQNLEALPLSLPEQSGQAKDIYYRFVVRMKDPVRFMRNMQRNGIVCRRPVFLPVHRTIQQRILPNAEQMWKEAVSLPIYPLLEEDAVTRIIGCMRNVLQ